MVSVLEMHEYLYTNLAKSRFLRGLKMARSNTYNDGRVYFGARGRQAPRRPVEDRYSTVHPIIRGFPTTDEFLTAVKREMKIRFYQSGSIKQYISRLNCFLKWFGHRPNRVTVETVREFLELLVDGGATSSTLSGYLTAIRNSWIFAKIGFALIPVRVGLIGSC